MAATAIDGFREDMIDGAAAARASASLRWFANVFCEARIFFTAGVLLALLANVLIRLCILMSICGREHTSS